ncbi:MAG TPA: hypothetical protein DEB24_04370, partial [Coriobacteriia bacterium]|nr:hypothetical protein [Coriobacteriia bacterium]
QYTYDAWGNPVATTGSLASTLGKDNPLRYRGYVYDTETGFYYLQSRYYDPSIGRMLNADTVSVIDVQKDFFDKNLYAYCGNNPVVRMDKDGRLWDTVFDVISLGVSIAGVVANPSDPMAWAAVGADVVSLAVPGLTGGGTIVRAVSVANKVADGVGGLSKAVDKSKVVIGEGMERVTSYASEKGYSIYGGLKSYPAISKRYGRPVAQKVGMAHNWLWIKKQVFLGRKVYDIGPAGKKPTSPNYRMELRVVGKYRNYRKLW